MGATLGSAFGSAGVLSSSIGDDGRASCPCGDRHPPRDNAVCCTACGRGGVWSHHALCDGCLVVALAAKERRP